MTQEQFEYLISDGAAEIIEQNIGLDPSVVALKGFGSEIATQIKYLQRSKGKIPTFYASRCIVPPLQYEQCSSEESARSKKFSGNLCIDLTCGLGVDSAHFSRNFSQVISIERDPLLCNLARYNFAKMGIENIEVVNSSAAEFLTQYSGEKPDLIYVDPARRDENKKVFLLEDCSPNMVDIMGMATAICDKIVVKLSPLFDVDMVYRLFGKYGSVTAQTVSLNGECKEVLAVVSKEDTSSQSEVIVIGGGKEKRFSFDVAKPAFSTLLPAEKCKFLYIPDVAFYKSRTVASLFSDEYNVEDFWYESQNGVVFCNSDIDNFAGAKYRIDSIMPYKPKELKKWLKTRSSKVKILKKDFPLSTDKLKKELSISDGDDITLLFTTISFARVVVVCC